MRHAKLNSTSFMILLCILATTLLNCTTALATIKVAVIDTGYDFKSIWGLRSGHKFPKDLTMPKICAGPHHDFTRQDTDKEYLKDNHGHGTHIAGAIAQHAQDADYCLLILKFYDSKTVTNNLKNVIDAIEYAIDQNVDVINLSLGGISPSEAEKKAIVKALDKGIVVVACAGNEYSDLSKHAYYPALYDERIIVVENIDSKGTRLPSSNYGPQVDVKEVGTNVLSLLPDNQYGYMSGTSQATAVVTGKIVKKLDKVKKLYDVVNPKYLKKQERMVA